VRDSGGDYGPGEKTELGGDEKVLPQVLYSSRPLELNNSELQEMHSPQPPVPYASKPYYSRPPKLQVVQPPAELGEGEGQLARIIEMGDK
jgi:hypothetical protein